MVDYEEDKKSKFNAGVAHVIRIDELQRALNAARYNPLGVNPELQQFNFQIMIDSLAGLNMEGWEKFTPEERKEVDRWEKVTKLHPPTFPFISVDKSGNMRIDYPKFNKLMDCLNGWEKKIKDLYGIHDLNSPSRGEGDDWDY